MENKTKIIIAVAVIVAIIIGIVVYLFLIKDNNEENNEENTIVEEVQENEIDEEDTNSVDEEQENGVEENVANDTVTESNVQQTTQEPQEQIIGREEQESINQNQGPTDEEKVIELAKNKWGANDTTVTFNIMNREGDIYMVSVNNKETTAVMTWYQVNVATGEVTQ